MSGEEVEGLKAMFNMMDTNRSGVLTFEEFKTGLRKLGSHLAEQEIRQLMDTVGHATYFEISLAEFFLGLS